MEIRSLEAIVSALNAAEVDYLIVGRSGDVSPVVPDWKWATAEGSRELDRMLDRRLTFREKLEWLEEAETLSLRFEASRKKDARKSP